MRFGGVWEVFRRCVREARLMVFRMQNNKRRCHTPFVLFFFFKNIMLKRKLDASIQWLFRKFWGRLLTLYRVPWCQTALDDDRAEKCSLCFRPCDTRLQSATVCFAVARSGMCATGSLPVQLFVSH